MAEIKGYLVYKLERMDTAAHDLVANSYQAIIDKGSGDYNRAAMEPRTGPRTQPYSASAQP